MPDKVVATHEQEQTLDALARRLEPQIYQEWKSELERRRLAALNSDLGMFGRMEAAAHLTDLLHGTQLSETAKQDRHFADLQSRLHIAVREIIASPNVTTRGIRPDGALVEVPRNIATQLKLDLAKHILSTADGGVVWRAVCCPHSCAFAGGRLGTEPAGNTGPGIRRRCVSARRDVPSRRVQGAQRSGHDGPGFAPAIPLRWRAESARAVHEPT